MKKVFVLLVGFLVAMSSTAEAQQKGKAKLSKECKTELRTFYQENVYPVKKAAHDNLMAGLSEEDVLFVNDQSGKKMAIREKMKAAKKEARAIRKNGGSKEDVKAKMVELTKPIKAEYKALKESMKPFMDRNQALIEEAMAPFKETRKKWRAEKKIILDKCLTEEQKAKREARKANSKKDKDNKKAKAKKGHGKIRFVLWNDKKENNEDVDDEMELEEGMFLED